MEMVILACCELSLRLHWRSANPSLGGLLRGDLDGRAATIRVRIQCYRHDRRGVMSRKRPDQALIDAARHKALAVSLATSRVRARLAAVAYNEGLQRVLPGTNVV